MAVMLAGGTYELGPEDGRIEVHTRREGAASLAGHDLTIAVTRWAATVTVDVRAPSRSTVTATADAGSLQVVSAEGGVAPLTEGQRADIARNVREAVLHSARHRDIVFTSTAVDGDLRAGVLTGDLTLVGRTRSVAFDVVVAASRGATTKVTATAAIAQTEFGITPYSALLGALRVRDVVHLSITVHLPTRSRPARPARPRP